jgi:hypothetical protein
MWEGRLWEGEGEGEGEGRVWEGERGCLSVRVVRLGRKVMR